MRHELDRYDSPAWFITAITPYVDISGTVFECCVGGATLTRELDKIPGVDAVYTNDIDRKVEANWHHDSTQPELWDIVGHFDWVITNPPYDDSAFKILKHAYHSARKGIIFFMRVTWEEPCNSRSQWLFEHPYTMKLTLPRFSFRRGKNGNWSTDACTIAAYVWEFDDENYGADLRQTKLRRSLSIPREQITGFYSRPENIC